MLCETRFPRWQQCQNMAKSVILQIDPAPPPGVCGISDMWAIRRWALIPSMVTVSSSKFKTLHFIGVGWNFILMDKEMHYRITRSPQGAGVAEWLSSWLAEQEVRGSIPRLATWISETGYLLLPSRDMAKIPLKRRKSSIQPTNHPTRSPW